METKEDGRCKACDNSAWSRVDSLARSPSVPILNLIGRNQMRPFLVDEGIDHFKELHSF